MSERRRRGRTPSMLKLASQQKESKLRYEEANVHVKSGNLLKALFSYNKSTTQCLDMLEPAKPTARLDTSRESEILQSFVRVNLQDEDAASTKTSTPHSKKTTKKIKKDVVRKRRRRIKPEELYTDKDRAAAVNMGTKDIKQSLKLKRQEDRSRALQIPEEADPATFLALGQYEMARKDIHIALRFINKALELNPLEKNSLVARSKCYILLGQPENALKDAETALTIDKKFLKAFYQKAESLYYLGDFEHSLMYFHRGLHLRPDHEDFKLGVEKAQKAIETALGIGVKKSVTPSSTSRSKSCSSRNVKGDSSQRSSSTVRSKTARQSRLLKELAVDKEYLDGLLVNPDIKCKYIDGDDPVVEYVREAVEYLNKRQEFWRQQQPPATRKF